jgi:ribonuclease PH
VRDSVKKGRALEISRMIGRSLRCVVDLPALGERQVIIDCDVIQADGGTRTASITGAYVALYDALRGLVKKGVLPRVPMTRACAAVSIGIVGGELLVDLCYEEDARADVDMNLVMDSEGSVIEIQGCAEGRAFPRPLLNTMLDMGEKAIGELIAVQKEALARD